MQRAVFIVEKFLGGVANTKLIVLDTKRRIYVELKAAVS